MPQLIVNLMPAVNLTPVVNLIPVANLTPVIPAVYLTSMRKKIGAALAAFIDKNQF